MLSYHLRVWVLTSRTILNLKQTFQPTVTTALNPNSDSRAKHKDYLNTLEAPLRKCKSTCRLSESSLPNVENQRCCNLVRITSFFDHLNSWATTLAVSGPPRDGGALQTRNGFMPRATMLRCAPWLESLQCVIPTDNISPTANIATQLQRQMGWNTSCARSPGPDRLGSRVRLMQMLHRMTLH